MSRPLYYVLRRETGPDGEREILSGPHLTPEPGEKWERTEDLPGVQTLITTLRVDAVVHAERPVPPAPPRGPA